MSVQAPSKEDVKYINFEVFPASVTFTETGTTHGNQHKVICSDKYLIVFVDKNVVQFVSEIVSYEKLSYKKYIVQTIDGEIIVDRESNCGCGNQLRGWHPYVGVPHLAQYPSLKGT